VSETRYADSDGVSIAYEVRGGPGPDVIFVPGFVSHLELWRDEPIPERFFGPLSSFARLITFDKREQGLSDRLGRPPTLEESMRDVLAVLDAAGSERAALLGVSEGGPMAALFAATYPERTRALILYGTYARLVRAPDYPQGLPNEALDRLTRRLRTEWGGPVGIDIWAPSAAEDRAVRDWWARLLRRGTSPGGAVQLMDLYREADVRSVLPAIRVPTLVLHRADDRMVRAAHGRYLADNIPGARYVELPGEDHLAIVGDVRALVDEIEDFLVGTRGAHGAERMLKTILFTDIVGSTDRAATLGDRRWRELVAAHDAGIRRALRAHHGREVKTLGDGFLATFDGPARAIRAAREARDGVRELGLEIRAGIHTGEVELVGDDVAGMAVNIGARVGALADAGEVLVSSTVCELVVGSGTDFEDRGRHALKGVPGEWRLFAVADDGAAEAGARTSPAAAASSP
jgi:class 3 adenylate cyclase